VHDVGEDGRGLDLPRAERVVAYISQVWRRPVSLHTTGTNGQAKVLSSEPSLPTPQTA
jgi:stage V sporulation protein R